MNDLQCPASVILAQSGADEGALSADVRDPAVALAASLSGRRVAMVYTSAAVAIVQVGEAVAATLGVPLRVFDDQPESAPGDEAVARLAAELESIADLHRGETVLVICHGDVIALALTRLSVARVPAAAREPAQAATVELSADADGWVCTSWTAALPR